MQKQKLETSSGIEIEEVHTPEDIKEFDYLNELGLPGEFPFTRGVYHNMYRGKLWTMRQYAGYADALESNKRYKYLLKQGQTGLSVAFDLPTQMGYDSDHSLSEAEVGKTGVAIDSLQDMETLFNGIPLDKIDIEFFIVKRKVLSWDDSNIMSPHQAYRVQTFTPPSGKIKLNKAKTAINEFIKECFNSNGNIKEKNYPATPSKWNCTFCPFKEEQELCGEGIIY